QAEDGIRDFHVTGVQTCALPICGPGTFEIIRLTGRSERLGAAWSANRVTAPAMGAGRMPLISRTQLPDDATNRRLAASMSRRTAAYRSAGSGTCVASGAVMTETWLPGSAAAPPRRSDTGTAATSGRSGRSPRLSSHLR